MQTTLLGLAIVFILALVTALVGPFVVDWGSHRSVFEHEASRLIGVDVHVAGAIDARLLPSPRLVLHDIAIGPAGKDQLRARSLGIEFGLGPLMRGEWRATEMDVTGPEVHLGLDKSGHVRTPTIAINFDPDALSVDKLSVQDGTVTLSDAANGGTMVLNNVWFNGDVRSLLGPVKGEGAFKIGGDLYPYRLAVSRFGEDSTLKLHLNIDPVSHPLSIESDGTLSLAQGAPRFDGTLKLARPVGIAQQSAGAVTQPWRIGGKIKATSAGALMEQVEFQYGSDEQAIKLSGTADFKFGVKPHFQGVLSGRQIDFDRVLENTGAPRPPPAAAFRTLAELAASAFRPTFPIDLGIGIDQVTLGGNTIQTVRGDISTDLNGWNLDRFEFRAPGLSQVRLSGRLAVDAAGVTFTGPAAIDAGDPRKFAAWLAGRPEPASGPARPLQLRGEMTLGSEKIAVERLQAKFDREAIAGRLVYVFAAGAKPSRLDASLTAPELDLDAALDFSKALLAGSSIEKPHDMSIALDIGRATLGGVEARKASARLRLDAEGLDVEKLSVADLGGAAFSASGRIDTAAKSPHGNMTLDLDARDLTGATAVLAKFAPATAAALRGAAPSMAPAKLHASLDIGPAAGGTQASLGVDGTLGGIHVALNGQGAADVTKFDVGDVHVSGKLDAKDGRALVALLGLDRAVAAGDGPGALTFSAEGPAHGDLRVSGKLTANGLDTSADGTVRLAADRVAAAALRLTVARADVAPLRGAAAIPVALTGRLALTGSDLKFNDLRGTIAGTTVRGRLALALGAQKYLSGEIDADSVDAGALIAAAIGMPSVSGGTRLWATGPFTRGTFAGVQGQITVKATRVLLTPRLTAREMSGTVKLDGDDIALDDFFGDLGGGRFAGQLSFRNSGGGIATHMKLSLDGADVTGLLPESVRPPLAGKLTVKAELDGSGMSPNALIGSLYGSGTVTLDKTQIARLDPRAFDVVARAVDKGMAVEPAKISGVVGRALDSGQLSVPNIGGNISISSGQIRLSQITAHGNDADVTVAGTLDLTDGSVDARLVLTGTAETEAGARPDIFMVLKGPLLSPSRTIDVSALTGWLTLRAVENQAKKLEAIEREHERELARQPAADVVAPVAATPTPAPMPAPLPVPRLSAPALAEKIPPAPHKKRAAPKLPPPIMITPAAPTVSVSPRN